MVKSDGKMTRMEEAITFVKTWQSSDSVDEVAKKDGNQQTGCAFPGESLPPKRSEAEEHAA